MITKDGKVVKTVMRSFSLGEISAVDRPAQAHATVAIMKRDTAPELKKLDVSMALSTMTGGHSHLITMGGGAYQQRAGNTDYTDGHSHPWLMDEAGNITIGHAQGHNHGIEIVSKGEMTEEALKVRLSKEGAPATTSDPNTPAGNPAAEAIGNTNEEVSMTPEERKAADEAAAVQKAETEKLRKQLQRAESVNSLSDAHRVYFKSLKGTDADAFLAAGDADRDETIRKAQEANQVVFTAADGTVYRKNDDPRLIELAKGFDLERKKRKESEEKAAKADLEKRASELTHIPGDLAVRVSLLKGIDALPEVERAPALAALKAQNERLGSSFQRIGTSDAPAADDTLDPLDSLAADIAKRDNITFEQAYSKALNTPQGQKLYNAHVAKRSGQSV
jgi:hypothetical protein